MKRRLLGISAIASLMLAGGSVSAWARPLDETFNSGSGSAGGGSSFTPWLIVLSIAGAAVVLATIMYAVTVVKRHRLLQPALRPSA